MTGATGFVGAHFMPLMAQHGYGLGGLCRASSVRAHLEGLPVTWALGDVTDAAAVDNAVRELCERADRRGRPAWLVHGAAVISYRTGSGALQEAVNVEGTRHVVDAARRYGVERLLHVSSVVTVGVGASADDVLDEDAPFEDVERVTGRPFVSEYMRTKHAAEELVLQASGDLDAVVVNPGAIFGVAPKPSNTAQIFRRAESSRIGRFAGPGSLSVVGVWDVAEGLRLALERGRPGRRYLLTDENLRLVELFERVLAELGSPRRPVVLSAGLWRALVAATRLVDRVRPLEVVTPTALELLGLHFRFDSTRARRELGWTPEPFDVVLRKTATWLRELGWVTGSDRA
jgi:dihydroflavonol-4-reductase